MIELNLGIIVLLSFLLLVILGTNIYLALIIPSTAYFLLQGFPITFQVQRLSFMLDNLVLLTIPLFIYVGSLMNEGGITDIIFDFANDVVGHISGGLAQINIIVSVVFSGISGSALADIGGVGKVLINRMVDEDYSPEYSAALTSSSAVIGPIFPPSIPLILFGIIAEVSVLALLLAGIVPALITALLLMIATYILAKKKDFPVHDERATVDELTQSFFYAFPAIATPIVLIGGLLAGFFGPTEAAAVTVAYILVINVAFYGERSGNYIWESTLDATRTTGTVLVILAGAGLFTYVMSIEGVDRLFAEYIFSISENPFMVMILVNIFLIVIGTFIDTIAALIMSIPIVVPPLVEVGYDPVHVGVIVVFNLMIGMLTPPLGLSLFLASDIANTEVTSTLSELKYYYSILLSALLLIILFPSLSLILV
jgi:tripartite ATP-independent transporter DctM subunit